MEYPGSFPHQKNTSGMNDHDVLSHVALSSLRSQPREVLHCLRSYFGYC